MSSSAEWLSIKGEARTLEQYIEHRLHEVPPAPPSDVEAGDPGLVRLKEIEDSLKLLQIAVERLGGTAVASELPANAAVAQVRTPRAYVHACYVCAAHGSHPPPPPHPPPLIAHTLIPMCSGTATSSPTYGRSIGSRTLRTERARRQRHSWVHDEVEVQPTKALLPRTYCFASAVRYSGARRLSTIFCRKRLRRAKCWPNSVLSLTLPSEESEGSSRECLVRRPSSAQSARGVFAMTTSLVSSWLRASVSLCGGCCCERHKSNTSARL